MTQEVSDAESVGSDIPAKPIEDTKAPEEQVNGELKDKVKEESAMKNDDDDEDENEEGSADEDEGV